MALWGQGVFAQLKPGGFALKRGIAQLPAQRMFGDKRVGLVAQTMVSAAPGPRDGSGGQGVLEQAHAVNQMGTGVNYGGFEPSSPQAATALMLAVVVSAIAAAQRLHHAAEAWGRKLSMQGDFVFCNSRFEMLQIKAVVGVSLKERNFFEGC
jgi:hypothetical protein